MITRFFVYISLYFPLCTYAQGSWICADSTHCEMGVNFSSMSRGVEITYDNLPSFSIRTISNNPDINDGYAEIDNNRRISFKLKAPVLNKPGFKMLLGFKYKQETYTFEDYNPLDNNIFHSLENKNLKTIGFDVYTLKPFKGRTYLALAAGVDFSGDFKGFLKTEKQFASYSAGALFGIKRNPNVEVAFGLAYSKRLGYNSVIPLIKYDHTFSNKWGLESMLPSKIKVRYNLNNRTIFRAGIDIKGDSYNIGVQNLGNSDITTLQFSRSYVQYGIEVDLEIKDPLFFTASAGYMQNVNFNFSEPGAARRDYTIQASGGGDIFFKVGLFITTPKKFRK